MAKNEARPEKSLRYGNIEGAVWRNEGEKGDFFNVTFSRRYRDGEEWKSSQSFSERDLPTLSKLALDLHSVVQVLKEKEQGEYRAGGQ